MAAGIEVVVGMHTGQSQERLAACRKMPRTFRVRCEDMKHPITTPCWCAVLGTVELDLVGLPGKALTQDATRSLRCVLHADGWSYTTNAADDVIRDCQCIMLYMYTASKYTQSHL